MADAMSREQFSTVIHRDWQTMRSARQ